jgi:hypothetical protein
VREREGGRGIEGTKREENDEKWGVKKRRRVKVQE